ncbi:MAG: peptide ABC transporter substrate-binding protein [Pyrinomonadaceae bacterium]
MSQKIFCRILTGIVLFSVGVVSIGCSNAGNSKYWGKIDVPKEDNLRYITGSEPESLDPQFVTGQPEARILIGLFDRLVEYHPKTMQPIPSLASSWETTPDGLVYTFHLRKDGKFSNGDPIKAKDFVWSFKRGLSPELASRYAFLGYDMKYGEEYNSGKSFVKKNGKFLPEDPAGASLDGCDLSGPKCLAVVTDEEGMKELKENDKDTASRIEGAEFVPVTADNVGISAVDDYTLKATLKQPAPYFVGLLCHQFFSALHQPSMDKFKKEWMKPENIVTSGAYQLESWDPYDQMTIAKSDKYWDAKNVKLNKIQFYPMDEQTTMMNIYKAGRVDALYNHTVPAAWNDEIKKFKDEYLLHPEVTIEYYTFSIKKKPFDSIHVRRAFSLSVNRANLEAFRKTIKQTADFVPSIFPEYEKARKKVFAELAKKDGMTEKDLEARLFDPAQACKEMKEAGYSVTDGKDGKCKVSDFPLDGVELTYNTAESNKAVAEFVQSQWKQNLGITIPLKNMEFKTFLPYRSAIEYKGMARAGWVGDYMDPFTFLSQFYSPKNDSSTGWWNPKYDALLDDANKDLDPTSRFEKMARAEYMMMMDQPVIPLGVAGTNWMKKPYVKGLYPNPGTMHPWKFVYIERDPSKWDHDVDKIMTEQSDPAVDAQVAALEKTQLDFEKSRTELTKKESGEKDAD